jgi:hypothetical protein
MLSIGKYINHSLSGITGITSISPLMAISGNTNYIVYKRSGITPEYTRDGCSLNRTSVQIDIMSTDYETSIDLAEKVRNKLESKTGVFNGVEILNAVLTNASENTDGNIYIQTLFFEFATT